MKNQPHSSQDCDKVNESTIKVAFVTAYPRRNYLAMAKEEH
jgi:hypothetical protein